MTFNLIALDQERLLGTAAIIGNPNSAFERQTPLDTKRHRRDIQGLLESVRSWSANKGPRTTTPEPAPATVVSAPRQAMERELLERDLADIRRLKGLAAPGGADAEYYARREAEIESKLAGLELRERAP